MNSMQIASTTFVALGLAISAAAFSQSSNKMEDVKTASELRELFANKTFKGRNWTAHYRSDGKGQFIHTDRKPEARTWKIKGEDQVCIATTGATHTYQECYRYERHKENRAWVTQINVANNLSWPFTLEDGIPKF